MKIFHLSDLHLGKIVNGFSMIDDQAHVIEQLYGHIEAERPDVLILAGDLYDRSVPPVQAIELLNGMFYRIIKELKTPVIAISGNHDSGERIDFASTLLKDSDLYISGTLKDRISRITLHDELGPVHFYPIPFADPAAVRHALDDPSLRTHDSAMKALIESVSDELDSAERNVAVAHGFITAMGENGEDELILETSESEKPLSIGGTDHISSSCFEIFDYTALGHLHGPQRAGNDCIRYSGSLIKYSFSEARQKKGITVVEMLEKGNVSTRFIPFSLRRDFRVITGELDELISAADDDRDSRDDYIKAVLTDAGELLDPMAKLRSVYPNAMELVRKDRMKGNSSSAGSSVNIRQRSRLELFEAFYEDVTGNRCPEEGVDIIGEVIRTVEEGLEI